MKSWPNKIKIHVRMDRIGNLIIQTVDRRYQRAFARVVRENDGPSDESAFLNHGNETSEFLADLRPSQRKDLDHGWDVIFLADPWSIAHLWGWDAHTIVEKGTFK